MVKCSACGYEWSYKDRTSDIRKKLFVRKIKARKMIKTAANKIMNYIPSDNNKEKYYAFLTGISMTKDKPVIWAIRQFMDKEEARKGRGFPYLRAMILNAGRDWDTRKKQELRAYGKSPKLITEKRKELKYE